MRGRGGEGVMVSQLCCGTGANANANATAD